MRAVSFWKGIGVAVCLGVGLAAAPLLRAQEEKFGLQVTPQQARTQKAEKMRNEKAAHTEWVSGVMRQIQTIKPGMTRADLLKVCTTEGGISNATQRRYVYKDCPYIKVDVRFRRAKAADDADLLKELPTDRITEISRPFLEWGILD